MRVRIVNMTECRRNIKLKVEVAPEHVGADWRAHLFGTACLRTQGRCSREHGYITRIHRITKLHDHFISRTNGTVIFLIEVLASCILPRVGDRLDAVVDMIFPHGVFCHYDVLRMMMPLGGHNNLRVRNDFSTNVLHDPRTNTITRKGDTLPVIVDDVRFENDLYSCIVKLA